MLEITTCKGLHVIFENEKDEVLLPHFILLSTIMATCVLQHSLV